MRPAEALDTARLLSATRAVAAAALLDRHWPTTGTRQDAFLALAGGLLRAGWSREQTEHFLQDLAVVSHDEETRKRLQVAAQTAAKQAEEKPTTGWPTLATLLGRAGPGRAGRRREGALRTTVGTDTEAQPEDRRTKVRKISCVT
jgi:hypothetical protein